MKIKDLKKGMYVRISNGEKEPPKHHNKKHSAWSLKNRTGYIREIEEDYNIIQLACTKNLSGVISCERLDHLSVEILES